MVDDNRDVLWAFEQVFRREGHVVTMTTRGEEALALLGGEAYDLAFIDAKLPDVDSHELARRMMHRSPRTVRVLISGYVGARDPDVVTALDAGLFSGFLAKPFLVRDIRQMVERVIRERGGGPDDVTDPGSGR